MRKFTTAVAALALLSTVALSGPANAAGQTISGEGSSFANGRISACAASYTTNNVTYVSSSSGNGRKAFNGVGAVQRDFAGSDAVYSATDVAPSKAFVYVPVTGGPIALAYNIGGVNKLQLDPGVIAAIFAGKITKWNDSRIAKINPSVRLPAKSITVGYREGSSGTTQNFVDYLIQSKSARTWTLNGTFESAAPSLPTLKFTAANSQVMATKIDATGYSIGYVDLFDTIDADLQFASIKNLYTAKVNGVNKLLSQYVKPTSVAAGLFLNAQTKNMAVDGSIKIDYTLRIKNAYPMSLFTYVIAPKKVGTVSSAATAAKGVAIKSFVNYVVNSCKATPGYATFPSTFKNTVTTKLISKIG